MCFNKTCTQNRKNVRKKENIGEKNEHIHVTTQAPLFILLYDLNVSPCILQRKRSCDPRRLWGACSNCSGFWNQPPEIRRSDVSLSACFVSVNSSCTDATLDTNLVRSQDGCPAQSRWHHSVWWRLQGTLYQVQLLQCDYGCCGRLWSDHQLDVLLRAEEHLFQCCLQGVRWYSGGTLEGMGAVVRG